MYKTWIYSIKQRQGRQSLWDRNRARSNFCLRGTGGVGIVNANSAKKSKIFELEPLGAEAAKDSIELEPRERKKPKIL